MSRITLVITDSSRIGCQALVDAVGRIADFEVIACATTVQGTLEALQSAPEVVLLSANLEDGRLAGFKALRELQANRSTARIVMLLDSSDRELVVASFRGGARGVFLRQQSLEELKKCVRTIHDGQIWVSNGQMEFLLQALASAVPLRLVEDSGPVVLTKRERDIIRLVAEGLTNRDISQRLQLSEHTVKNYLFRIFDKLGVSTRVELVLYAQSSFHTAA